MKKVIFLTIMASAMLLTSCDIFYDVKFNIIKDETVHNPNFAVYNASDNFKQEKKIIVDESIADVKLTCLSGDKICWGAWDGTTEWGLGEAPTETVDNACFKCSSSWTETVEIKKEDIVEPPETASMTWEFTKELGTANPTIALYDHTDGNTKLRDVALDEDFTTVTVECTVDNEICYGGDFELAGDEFVIGCGEGCTDVQGAIDAGENPCRTCADTTIEISFENFLK